MQNACRTKQKGRSVPAIDRAGVNSADHGRAWPAAGTPTPGSRHTRRRAGPRSTATPRNSSYEPTAGADTLRLEWTRSVKGDLAAAVALGSGSYLAVNAQTSGGCSLMVWETDNRARQRWCTRLVQGGGASSPLFDGFDNLYVGQPGAMLSFPPTQWIRWRQPVIGMPTTPRILTPGHLLVVTHLGQVLVFDAHKGVVVGSPLDLVAGVDPKDSERGLADCRPARARCPVAAAPAFARADRNRRARPCGSPTPRRLSWSGCATARARTRC